MSVLPGIAASSAPREASPTARLPVHSGGGWTATGTLAGLLRMLHT